MLAPEAFDLMEVAQAAIRTYLVGLGFVSVLASPASLG